MKNFKEWFLPQKPEFQDWLAQRCDTTTEYLKSLAYGSRKPGKQLHMLLEIITGEEFEFPANSESNEEEIK